MKKDRKQDPSELHDLQHFFNAQGQATLWPAKPKKQMALLLYLAEKFTWDKHYAESEVNALLKSWHTFGDPALLRRELYMKHFLDRTPDGSRYWRTAGKHL